MLVAIAAAAELHGSVAIALAVAIAVVVAVSVAIAVAVAVEYNSFISIENKHTPGYLLLKQDPESLVHNSDLLNFIPCELDLTSIPFYNTTILTYKI